MMKRFIAVARAFVFWNRATLLVFLLCVGSILLRQWFRGYWSPDMRSVLKSIHIFSGYLLIVCVFFHGIGHSRLLLTSFKQKDDSHDNNRVL